MNDSSPANKRSEQPFQIDSTITISLSCIYHITEKPSNIPS